MVPSMLAVIGIIVLLFGAMLAAAEMGYRRGRRRAALDPEGASAGTGAVEAAVFGLLGLLLAFTFSGAASRFDTRRALVVEEANDIGTAWLRLDLLSPEDQPALRDLFRAYLDTRIAAYRKLPDLDAARRELARSAELQAAIWRRAHEACRRADTPREATVLLLPALNAMIDITTTRTWSAFHHMPSLVFISLFLVALLASVLVGDALSGAARRNLLHAFVFSAAIALTIYVIIDFEYPRVGIIRLDDSDQVLVELRESFK